VATNGQQHFAVTKFCHHVLINPHQESFANDKINHNSFETSNGTSLNETQQKQRENTGTKLSVRGEMMMMMTMIQQMAFCGFSFSLPI
jgi:hypothetical protein